MRTRQFKSFDAVVSKFVLNATASSMKNQIYEAEQLAVQKELLAEKKLKRLFEEKKYEAEQQKLLNKK